jgi:hypothetical protein
MFTGKRKIEQVITGKKSTNSFEKIRRILIPNIAQERERTTAQIEAICKKFTT